MKKVAFTIALVAAFCWCCKRTSNNAEGQDSKIDTTRFFQVSQYLKGEINEVNATPFFIYRLNKINNNTDSTPVNIQVFNQLSAQFLSPDINDEKLKPFYSENIFEDETTKTITISYSTTNKDLTLQHVEVLLNEDGQTVKRVFLRKFYNYPDSSAIEQLSWKPGESFQISRSVQKTDNSENLKQTTVVWNKNS